VCLTLGSIAVSTSGLMLRGSFGGTLRTIHARGFGEVSSLLIRRILLLGVPLAVALLGATHVAVLEPTAFQALRDHVEWWIVLHILQLPLFGLLALAVYTLTDGLRGPLVLISRIGLAVFAIFYTAADAILGIARGLLVRYARDMSPDAQAVLEPAIDSLASGLVIDSLAGIGAVAFLVAGVAAALALARSGVPRLTAVLIGLGAVVFGISHAPPIGPAGMLIFLAGAARLELRRGAFLHPASTRASTVKLTPDNPIA
jgi:hypothetical protein